MDQHTLDRSPRRIATRPRVTATVGAVVLLLTAAVHATGFPGAVSEVADPPVDEFFHDLLPGLWLFFSWHLAIVAAAVLWVTWRRRGDSRTMIGFAAVVTLGDTVWVGILADWLFPGTWLLAVAAACLVAAAQRWPNPSRPA